MYSAESFQFPDGTSASESEMLDKLCALAVKKCKANMKAYKARKGDSRLAWLVSTMFRLWPK